MASRGISSNVREPVLPGPVPANFKAPRASTGRRIRYRWVESRHAVEALRPGTLVVESQAQGEIQFARYFVIVIQINSDGIAVESGELRNVLAGVVNLSEQE